MTNFYDILFLGFSINIIISCLLTINAYNSIAGLIALIFAFINTTCLFFLMELEFLGLLILIVYIGAISVLFLFSVMLFNLKEIVKSKNNTLVLKSFFFIIFIFSIIYLLLELEIFPERLFIIFPETIPYEVNLSLEKVSPALFNKINEVFYNHTLYEMTLQFNLLEIWPKSELFTNKALYEMFIPNINSELYILGQVLYDVYIIYLLLTGVILLIGMIGAITLINNSKSLLQYQHSSRQISTNINKRNESQK